MTKQKFLKLLFDTNRDLLIRSKKATSKYVVEEDLMLMNIGSMKNSAGIDISDGLTVHYNIDTLKITGFTILNVKNWIDCSENEVKNKEISTDSIASYGLSSLSFA